MKLTNLGELRQILTTYFNDEELRTLCQDINVDYDNLRGDGKEAKARELVALLNREDRILDLVRMASQQRPNAPWSHALSNLIQNARNMERKGAYEEATKTWEILRLLDSNNPKIAQEIQQLREKSQQKDPIQDILRNLWRNCRRVWKDDGYL
jgi:hypothetical protein